jgi:hypothetical protein
LQSLSDPQLVGSKWAQRVVHAAMMNTAIAFSLVERDDRMRNSLWDAPLPRKFSRFSRDFALIAP